MGQSETRVREVGDPSSVARVCVKHEWVRLLSDEAVLQPDQTADGLLRRDMAIKRSGSIS